MRDYEEFEQSIEQYFDQVTGAYIGPDDSIISIKQKANELCRKYLKEGKWYYDVHKTLANNEKTLRFIKEIGQLNEVDKFVDETMNYNVTNDLNKTHTFKIDLHNKGQNNRPFNFVYIYSKKKPDIKDKTYLKVGFKDGRMAVCIHFSSYK